MTYHSFCELDQSIDPRTQVRIAYTNGYGEPSIRKIEPIRSFEGRNGYTYLKAYCHLREEERTFRMDRISSWSEAEEFEVEEDVGASYTPNPEMYFCNVSTIYEAILSAAPHTPTPTDNQKGRPATTLEDIIRWIWKIMFFPEKISGQVM